MESMQTKMSCLFCCFFLSNLTPADLFLYVISFYMSVVVVLFVLVLAGRE